MAALTSASVRDGRATGESSRRFDPGQWPRWTFISSAALVAGLAVLMFSMSDKPGVVAPLAVLMTVPSLFHMVGRHPPWWLFLALALTPPLLLNTVLYDAAGSSAAAFAASVAVWVQGESVAAYAPRPALVGVAFGGAVVVAHLSQGQGLEPAYLLSFSAVAVAGGYLLRKQQQTVLQLRDAQAQLVGEARLLERQRIAREVHDVVAHSLTVTMMHLTAARMSVLRDPASAVEALEEAEKLGRRSLAEIRDTVALLRSDAERATDPALPDIHDVVTLVEGYRLAGLDVSFRTRGNLDVIAANTGLTLYRVVQEALANAVRHAPGSHVDLQVTVTDSTVAVQVSNPVTERVGRPSSGGMGLRGMHERVALAAGELTAEPHDGRWIVHATVPTNPDPPRFSA